MGNQTPQGFTMDKVSVELAFSAEGKLVFIAEAGLEASITIESTGLELALVIALCHVFEVLVRLRRRK